MDKTEYLKIIVWLLASAGGVVIFIGGLIGYIFTAHTKNADRRFSENREEHCEIYRELRKKQDKRKR